jgi:hypothetical protein
MTAAGELDAMLADLAERAQAIRNFACMHGLERHSTRRSAKRVIALIAYWRQEVAAAGATLSDSRCFATAQRVGSADTSGPPSADRSNDASKPSGSDQVRAQAPRAGR